MRSWMHRICEACWRKREPEREPIRVREHPPEPCCFCGANTTAGIYVREAPWRTLCKTAHGSEEG
jgi:hypothetical protein